MESQGIGPGTASPETAAAPGRRHKAEPLLTWYAALVYYITLFFVFLWDTLVFGMAITGRSNLNKVKGSALLVSNHSLYLDPAIVAHALFPRRTWYTAMEPTFNYRYLSSYLYLLGAFPVADDRPFSEVIRAAKTLFARGKFLHMFPEAELEHVSHRVRPFKPGVFYLAHLLDQPVLPVLIKTRHKTLFGKRLHPHAVRVTVHFAEPIRPAEYKRPGLGKKEAVAALEARVRTVMEEHIHE